MDPTRAFLEIEALYSRVLDLTRKQEALLQTGDLAPIPPLLGQKTEALNSAQRLTTGLRESSADPNSEAFQRGLARVASVLADIVRAEERCGLLVPSGETPRPRREAIAAYRGNRT